jgi:hypothetical protein
VGLPAGVKLLPGGLIVYKLTKSDRWYLGVYLALLVWPAPWSALTWAIYYLGYYEDLRPKGNWHIYYFSVGVIVALLTTVTSLSLRFRNLRFSLAWIGLTLALCVGTQQLSAATMPLGVFLYSHLVRLQYWSRHQVEFVPWEFDKYKGFVRSHYALEDRWSTREERGYSVLYHWIGYIVLFSTL